MTSSTCRHRRYTSQVHSDEPGVRLDLHHCAECNAGRALVWIDRGPLGPWTWLGPWREANHDATMDALRVRREAVCGDHNW